MAYLISRFATGVIATMDLDNPKVEIVGMKPWAGVLFKVYWWMLVCHDLILSTSAYGNCN